MAAIGCARRASIMAGSCSCPKGSRGALMVSSSLLLPSTVDPRRWLGTKVSFLILLIGIADWLFWQDSLFQGGWFGAVLPCFAAVLAATTVLTQQRRASGRQVLLAAGLFGLCELPLVEDVNPVSVGFGVIGPTAFLIFWTAGPVKEAAWRFVRHVIGVGFCGPYHFCADFWRIRAVFKGRRKSILGRISVAAWAVPLVLSALFFALFYTANPLIERGLSLINVSMLPAPWRVTLWFLIALFTWPWLSVPRWRRKARSGVPALAVSEGSLMFLARFFGTAPVVRSLVLFNLLFAVQSLLDGTYLWARVALPDGVTYADYAHRGAYPLILVALLAGAFVLLAMRPNGPARQSGLVRSLVLIWVAQTILLVISSMLRLKLYVEIYSLTEVRVAAFLWMLLVLVGLILIVVQILRRHSNRWFLGANTVALVAALYGANLVDTPAVIAAYNIAHCHEMGGQGPSLDLWYLASLGPSVIPALETMPKNAFMDALLVDSRPLCRGDFVDMLSEMLQASSIENWRQWTFRRWRLNRNLTKDSWLAAAIAQSASSSIPASGGFCP